MEIFSKFLSESDTTVRLAIPTTSLPHFQNLRRRDLLVRDWAEEEWTFRFSIRNIGHPRPVFSGDWVKFSQAKGLQPYDLLIFSRLEDGEYRIELVSKWIKVDLRSFRVSSCVIPLPPWIVLKVLRNKA
ncbi:hypothetical protein Pint_28681 [Pistacia integerrima]|uniref:Uncharacterized protein n=1 Tax=Pistacia integerrima TaxID=434235 RepID=A0ACC0YRK7_9ROSI|nr:hypothetical protein Pint_28681 [Pistacia integerrima]